MPIAEGASLVGGAALGAPFSEILKLLIEWVKKVKDFKPLSQDLTSTMGRMVPLFNEINLMQPGTCTGELNYLINTMQRAEELLRKCSNVQWYSIIDRALYSKEIEKIHEDFFRFCQMELQLIQLRNQHVQYREQVEYMRSLETKIDLLSVTGKESSELFRVPLPEEVTVCWLLRPVRKLKKMLFEDGVVSVVVSAPSACGKTSLVTKLCHDADVKGKFNHILFVTVSKAPNIRLTLQMLHVHTGCTANEFPSDFDASLCIEQALMQLSQTGPVLLVLDDVWPEEESFLEKFLIHLPDYKILVTSRFEFPNFGPTFHLEPFIDEDVKNIFLKSAPDPNCASCSKLGHSLQKVLKHCNGFPLATNNPCREASGDLGCPSDTSEFSGSAQKQNKGKRRDEDEPETPKEHLVKSENIRKEPLVQTTSNGNKADSSPSDTSEFSGSAQKPDKGKRRDEDETETPIEHSGKMAEVRKETFVQTKSNGTKAGSSPRPVFDEPPTDFICPISREIMQDPHIAADGFTYEAETIRTWLRGGAQRSPITNARLADQHLIPNYTLRSMIGDWLQQHPNYNVD